MKTPPVVELTLPVLPDMELAATNTAEVVAKHMGLNEEKSAEISMALIEACINAFLRIATWIRFVVLVAIHRARTLKVSAIKASVTVPIAMTESNVVLLVSDGNIEVIESGSFWSPRILSKTIFVAAGGIKPIIEPNVRNPRAQKISARFFPTILKNSRSNSENDLLRSLAVRPVLMAVISPDLTDSPSFFLKFRNLFLLDKCFAMSLTQTMLRLNNFPYMHLQR